MAFEVVHECHKAASLLPKLGHSGCEPPVFNLFFFIMTLDSVGDRSATVPIVYAEYNHQTFKYSLLGIEAEVALCEKPAMRTGENQDAKTEMFITP